MRGDASLLHASLCPASSSVCMRAMTPRVRQRFTRCDKTREAATPAVAQGTLPQARPVNGAWHAPLGLAETVGSLSFLQRSAELALSGTRQVFEEVSAMIPSMFAVLALASAVVAHAERLQPPEGRQIR